MVWLFQKVFWSCSFVLKIKTNLIENKIVPYVYHFISPFLNVLVFSARKRIVYERREKNINSKRNQINKQANIVTIRL